MARTHLSRLVFVFAALPLNASFITFSATATSQTGFAKLGIQQFDPTLGTLDSMSYQLRIGGLLTWDIASYVGNGASMSAVVSASTSFLGAAQFNQSFLLSGFAFNPPSACGTAASPTPCDNFTSGLYAPVSGCPIITAGVLSNGQFDFFNRSSCQGPLQPGIKIGTAPGDLSMFVGNSILFLPVSTDASGVKDVLFGSNWALESVRYSGQWNLTGQYNYTSAVSVTVTPEPRFAVAFLIAALGTGVVLRRRRIS